MSGLQEQDTTAQDAAAEEVTKQTIRMQVWQDMMKNDISVFPKPFGRIPNFKGVTEASEKLLELEDFQQAKAIIVGPDKPLETVRLLALENGKDLYVPIPRLKNWLLKKLSKDDNADIKKVVNRWGIENTGKPVDLEEELHIDLLVMGSVAVSKEGHRIGKGKGYSDLEYAILKVMKAVDENTIIVTVVHDSQVFDELPVDLFKKHDVPVDYIVTPTQVIKVETCLPKPAGVYWDLLSKKRVTFMDTLQRLKKKQESDGVDTTLKEIDSDNGMNGRRRFRRPFRKVRKSSDEDNSTPKEDRKTPRTPRRKFQGRRYNRKKSQTDSSTEENNKDPLKDANPTSGRRRPSSKRTNRRFHIDFSLLVSNIERNVRVRDLKNALTEHGVKPDDITWKGYKGFCYLHYGKPFKKQLDKENEKKPFSVNSVVNVLQSLKLSDNTTCNLDVKIMEPISRIETTDITAV